MDMDTARIVTPDAFERQVEETPDLELSWMYWNWILSETTGRAIWYLFIWPQFRDFRDTEIPFRIRESRTSTLLTQILHRICVKSCPKNVYKLLTNQGLDRYAETGIG